MTVSAADTFTRSNRDRPERRPQINERKHVAMQPTCLFNTTYGEVIGLC
jgi:hypothetical protein